MKKINTTFCGPQGKIVSKKECFEYSEGDCHEPCIWFDDCPDSKFIGLTFKEFLENADRYICDEFEEEE